MINTENMDIEKISDETMEVVHRLVFLNEYHESILGNNESLIAYKLLVQIANENELVLLSAHPNGIVRFCAFMALLSKESTKTKDIFKILSDDQSLINYRSGCVVHPRSIARIVTDLYAPEPLRIIYKKKPSLLKQMFTKIKDKLFS